MDQLNNYSDERLLIGCTYCDGKTGTRDHVPSRVLLEQPYPENLPVVPTCPECNAGFSLDEAYLACLIECARTGSVESVERPKVRRIFDESPSLSARLKEARTVSDCGLAVHSIEDERVRRIVLKLARGHAAYELSEQLRGGPSRFIAVPLNVLSTDDRDYFEEVPVPSAWPEVGTRALQRVAVLTASNTTVADDWIEVQPERYRYFAVANGVSVTVRIVIGEYLACEVIWAQDS